MPQDNGRRWLVKSRQPSNQARQGRRQSQSNQHSQQGRWPGGQTTIPTIPTATPTIPTLMPSAMPRARLPSAIPTSSTSIPVSTRSVRLTSVPTSIPLSTPTSTPAPVSTAVPTSTPALISTAVPTTPAPISTAVPTSTPALISTAVPTSTPAPISTAVPISTPALISTAVPTTPAPAPISTAVPTSTPAPISTAIPISTPVAAPTRLSSIPTSISSSKATPAPNCAPSRGHTSENAAPEDSESTADVTDKNNNIEVIPTSNAGPIDNAIEVRQTGHAQIHSREWPEHHPMMQIDGISRIPSPPTTTPLTLPVATELTAPPDYHGASNMPRDTMVDPSVRHDAAPGVSHPPDAVTNQPSNHRSGSISDSVQGRPRSASVYHRGNTRRESRVGDFTCSGRHISSRHSYLFVWTRSDRGRRGRHHGVSGTGNGFHGSAEDLPRQSRSNSRRPLFRRSIHATSNSTPPSAIGNHEQTDLTVALNSRRQLPGRDLEQRTHSDNSPSSFPTPAGMAQAQYPRSSWSHDHRTRSAQPWASFTVAYQNRQNNAPGRNDPSMTNGETSSSISTRRSGMPSDARERRTRNFENSGTPLLRGQNHRSMGHTRPISWAGEARNSLPHTGMDLRLPQNMFSPHHPPPPIPSCGESHSLNGPLPGLAVSGLTGHSLEVMSRELTRTNSEHNSQSRHVPNASRQPSATRYLNPTDAQTQQNSGYVDSRYHANRISDYRAHRSDGAALDRRALVQIQTNNEQQRATGSAQPESAEMRHNLGLANGSNFLSDHGLQWEIRLSMETSQRRVRTRNAQSNSSNLQGTSNPNSRDQALNPEATPYRSVIREEMREEMARARRMSIPVNVDLDGQSDLSATRESQLNPDASEFSPSCSVADGQGNAYTMTTNKGVSYFRPDPGACQVLSDPRYVINHETSVSGSDPNTDNLLPRSVSDTHVSDQELQAHQYINQQQHELLANQVAAPFQQPSIEQPAPVLVIQPNIPSVNQEQLLLPQHNHDALLTPFSNVHTLPLYSVQQNPTIPLLPHIAVPSDIHPFPPVSNLTPLNSGAMHIHNPISLAPFPVTATQPQEGHPPMIPLVQCNFPIPGVNSIPVYPLPPVAPEIHIQNSTPRNDITPSDSNSQLPLPLPVNTALMPHVDSQPGSQPAVPGSTDTFCNMVLAPQTPSNAVAKIQTMTSKGHVCSSRLEAFQRQLDLEKLTSKSQNKRKLLLQESLSEPLKEIRNSSSRGIADQKQKPLQCEEDTELSKEITSFAKKLHAFKIHGKEDDLKQILSEVPSGQRPAIDLAMRLINLRTTNDAMEGAEESDPTQTVASAISTFLSLSKKLPVEWVQSSLRLLPEVGSNTENGAIAYQRFLQCLEGFKSQDATKSSGAATEDSTPGSEKQTSSTTDTELSPGVTAVPEATSAIVPTNTDVIGVQAGVGQNTESFNTYQINLADTPVDSPDTENRVNRQTFNFDSVSTTMLRNSRDGSDVPATEGDANNASNLVTPPQTDSETESVSEREDIQAATTLGVESALPSGSGSDGVAEVAEHGLENVASTSVTEPGALPLAPEHQVTPEQLHRYGRFSRQGHDMGTRSPAFARVDIAGRIGLFEKMKDSR